MTKIKCDGNCFNCVFEDCINDSNNLTENEKHDKAIAKARRKMESRQKLLARKKAYYLKNKEKMNEQMRVWRENHPEYNKEYYHKNKMIKGEKVCI